MSNFYAKNTRKNLVFTGFGYALPLLAALLTIPIMVSQLGTDLYGLYVICISLIGFMTLVDLGVGQTVVKYVSAYEASGEQLKVQPVLSVAFLVYLLIGLVSVLALYFAAPALSAALYDQAERQALAQEVLRITTLPLFFSYINQFFLNVCKAYHRFDFPAVIHNGANLGGIVLAAILLLLGYPLPVVMWGYVVIQLLAFIAGYLSSMKVVPSGVYLFPSFNHVIFREIVSFSVYTFISNFIGSLTSRADKLLIGTIIGTEAVTYYQIPFTIAQMANGIVHTLTHISFPRFSELFSRKEYGALLLLYRKVSILIFLLSTAIAVLLITVGGDFLSLWISAEFASKATLVLQVMALYFFFHSNTVVGYWILQGGGKAKLTALIAALGAVLYFLALFYLGESYGYLGAAMALFMMLVPTPLQYLWIARRVGHPYRHYLSQLLFFLICGYFMIYCLELVNAYLMNPLLEILVDGVLVTAIMGLAAAWVVGMLPIKFPAFSSRVISH